MESVRLFLNLENGNGGHFLNILSRFAAAHKLRQIERKNGEKLEKQLENVECGLIWKMCVCVGGGGSSTQPFSGSRHLTWDDETHHINHHFPKGLLLLAS